MRGGKERTSCFQKIERTLAINYKPWEGLPGQRRRWKKKLSSQRGKGAKEENSSLEASYSLACLSMKLLGMRVSILETLIIPATKVGELNFI